MYLIYFFFKAWMFPGAKLPTTDGFHHITSIIMSIINLIHTFTATNVYDRKWVTDITFLQDGGNVSKPRRDTRGQIASSRGNKISRITDQYCHLIGLIL